MGGNESRNNPDESALNALVANLENPVLDALQMLGQPLAPSSITSSKLGDSLRNLSLPYIAGMPLPPAGLNDLTFNDPAFTYSDKVNYVASVDRNYGQIVTGMYSGHAARDVAMGTGRDPFTAYAFRNLTDWMFSQGAYAKKKT